MIRILLLCSAGMSTSILVNNMRKYAGPDDEIKACPLGELEYKIEDCDVILVSPQIRFQFDLIKALAETFGKKAGLIDPYAYSHMEEAKILQEASDLMRDKVVV